MSEPSGPVVIARFRDLNDALLAQTVMDAAGIEARLHNENLVRIYWGYSNAVGGIELAVRSEDADRARALLRTDAAGDVPDDEAFEEGISIEEDREQCPRCGSDAATPNSNAGLAALVGIALLGVATVSPKAAPLFFLAITAPMLILLFGPNRRCAQCGRSWHAVSRETPIEEAEAPDELEPPDDPTNACPRCGSPETARVRSLRLQKASILMFALLPFALIDRAFRRRRCSACDARWW